MQPHCKTLVQPSFLGVHPVRCHLAAPVWRDTVQAQWELLAWPGAACMRHARCEMLGTAQSLWD